MGAARDAALSGRNRAHRQSVAKRQLAVDQMSRETNAKIRWNATTQSTIGLHRLVFPGWQPKLNSWQVLSDLDEFPQVIKASQSAGIVPSEEAIARAQKHRPDRIHPAGSGKAIYALFHGS